MQALSEAKITQFCGENPGWKFSEGKLIRVSKFEDFVQAMAFVNEVATMAETAGHHPDIDIRYNTVTLGLVTHDADGITERDLDMASRLTALF